jgi:hypothetical protein
MPSGKAPSIERDSRFVSELGTIVNENVTPAIQAMLLCNGTE